MIRNNSKKNKIEFIEILVKLYESKKYKKYIESNPKYKKYIEESKKLDYWGIQFFDVVDNYQMNKLNRSIKKLKRSKYNYKMNLKTSKWRLLNYFRLEYDSSSISSLCKIEFLEDDFIKSIDIGYSQINNNEAIIEYEIHFKKILTYDSLIQFILDNKKEFSRSKFTDYYFLDSVESYNELSQIDYMINKTFKQCVQAKIDQLIKLGIGRKYSLPSMAIINFQKNSYSEDEFKNLFLKKMIKTDKKNQYLVINLTDSEGLEMNLYFSGNKYTPLYLGRLISRLRMDFYYFLFDNIERMELNNRVNKYFRKTKKRIKSKDYKWLVNKLRSIKDNKIHMSRKNDRISEISTWKQYYDGEEEELDFIKAGYSKKYEVIYEECLNHINVLYSLQKENLIILIAVFTFISTLIGIVVTMYIN